MAFTIFQHSTTANATEINANFYHVAQGDRLPRSGGSLTAADSTYNVGSSSYIWDEIYCIQPYVSNWSVTAEYYLSVEITATTASIEIIGLNDNLYKHHIIDMIIFPKLATASTQYMVINSDSSASYCYIRYNTGNPAAVNATSQSYIYLGDGLSAGTTTSYHRTTININSKDSSYKIINAESTWCVSEATAITSTSVFDRYLIGAAYQVASTMTSIKFYSLLSSVYDIGTKINIWRK